MTAADRLPAPPFTEGLDWINVDHPLTLAELRGKVVLLDFWTYGCINCIHVIPQLRELERGFADELAVIGVHAGKFRAERLTSNIAQAARRYGVEHPIVNDRQFRIWRAYDVGAWPTMVLIDAHGRLVASLPGEFVADDLAPTIADLIREAGSDLNRAPLPVQMPPESDTLLRFPSKVLAVSRERVFVADTGHNRILELSVAGERAQVVRQIGSGERGFADGSLAEARFAYPQGMALQDELLYVADTENHAVRVVDLRAGAVTTLAGALPHRPRTSAPAFARPVQLNSPWDVAVLGDALVVAMAGAHQLWRISLADGAAGPLVGTGREDLTDGPAFRCTLAQPTGVRASHEVIYFADAESSAIREARPGRDGYEVRTIVGQGLFDFGDDDGKGGRVRLQHPYGLAEYEGQIYVADTYNNKVKHLDPATGECVTLLGSGEEGLVDGGASDARFDEPQGVSVVDGLLFIADTNNHALRVADLRPTDLRAHDLHAADLRAADLRAHDPSGDAREAGAEVAGGTGDKASRELAVVTLTIEP